MDLPRTNQSKKRSRAQAGLSTDPAVKSKRMRLNVSDANPFAVADDVPIVELPRLQMTAPVEDLNHGENIAQAQDVNGAQAAAVEPLFPEVKTPRSSSSHSPSFPDLSQELKPVLKPRKTTSKPRKTAGLRAVTAPRQRFQQVGKNHPTVRSLTVSRAKQRFKSDLESESKSESEVESRPQSKAAKAKGLLPGTLPSLNRMAGLPQNLNSQTSNQPSSSHLPDAADADSDTFELQPKEERKRRRSRSVSRENLYDSVIVDGEQLSEFCRLFDKQGARNFRPYIVVLNRKFRRNLSEGQQLQIVFLRFGYPPNWQHPPRSYGLVAKKLGLPYSTVVGVLNRFISNGYRVILGRRFNAGARGIIEPELAEYLKCPETLQAWAGLTLKKRVVLLQKEKQITLSPSTLYAFYRRNEIRFLHTNVLKKFDQSQAWYQSRHNFCYALADLIKSGRPFMYIDETSVNSWSHKTKTFRAVNDNTRIIIPATREAGCTIFGAIGESLAENYVFHFAHSTCSKSFIEFLRVLRSRCYETDYTEIVLILDNHRAHSTPEVRSEMRLLNFKPMYLPTYSPDLNSIEYLWSIVKRRMTNSLAHLAQLRSISRETFLNLVLKALSFKQHEVVKAISSNRKCVFSCLQMLQRKRNAADRMAQAPVEAKDGDPVSGNGA